MHEDTVLEELGEVVPDLVRVHFTGYVGRVSIADGQKLGENAAGSPDIDGVVIMFLFEQDLRSAVVTGLHIRG